MQISQLKAHYKSKNYSIRFYLSLFFLKEVILMKIIVHLNINYEVNGVKATKKGQAS